MQTFGVVARELSPSVAIPIVGGENSGQATVSGNVGALVCHEDNDLSGIISKPCKEVEQNV